MLHPEQEKIMVGVNPLVIVYEAGTNNLLDNTNLDELNNGPLNMKLSSLTIVWANSTDLPYLVGQYGSIGQLVVVTPGSYREFGFAADLDNYINTHSRVVTLSNKGLNLAGPFRKTFAKWTLWHELGHVQG